MIRRIDLRGRGSASETPDYRALVPRAELDVDAAVEAVRATVERVKHHGDEALLEIASRDGVEVTDLRVPPAALAEALAALDPDVRAAFEESARRLREVSEAELERGPGSSPEGYSRGPGSPPEGHSRGPGSPPEGHSRDLAVEVVPGGRVTQRMVPYRRVGMYVPAGITALASTVVMTVVPAQVAGVESIALASPAQKEFGGLPHPTVLAVCALLGVDEVYTVGGVGAVAMFAYGTAGCPRADFVAGPGRITTVAAKRLVKGIVGIDSEAGPTEILILADDTADPAFVAADLISQAEHDEMAAAVLVTPSETLATAVEHELSVQVPQAKHSGRIGYALRGQQSGIVLVDDLDQGSALADAYAAEHLEIHTADAETRAARVRNAGAVFVGPWSPVSLGDYCAGSNHVLPTGGCACHSSGLSVRSFRKAVHVITYDRPALASAAPHVAALAEAEDLPAHAAAVAIREGTTS